VCLYLHDLVYLLVSGHYVWQCLLLVCMHVPLNHIRFHALYLPCQEDDLWLVTGYGLFPIFHMLHIAVLDWNTS